MLFSFVVTLFMQSSLFRLMVLSAEGLAGDAQKAAQAEAYTKLYWGSVILGLGNGTVEAFINPVVTTMFKKDKTK